MKFGGPSCQIHSPYLNAGAPGIFSYLLGSVQILKREWGAESNGKLPQLSIPSKLPLSLNYFLFCALRFSCFPFYFSVYNELQPRFLIYSEGPALGQNIIYIINENQMVNVKIGLFTIQNLFFWWKAPKNQDQLKRLLLNGRAGALWLANHYPSTLVSVSVTGFCYFAYQAAIHLSLWGWAEPFSEPYTAWKFSSI